jgi:isopenicillin N synthase-like dioxygenase
MKASTFFTANSRNCYGTDLNVCRQVVDPSKMMNGKLKYGRSKPIKISVSRARKKPLLPLLLCHSKEEILSNRTIAMRTHRTLCFFFLGRFFGLLLLFLLLLVNSIATARSTSSIASSSSSSLVVSISYQDLARAFGGPTYYKDDNEKDETENPVASSSSCPDHLLTAIAEAFGPDGLGFLEITNVPFEMVALRQTVLTLAPQLASLPLDELNALTLPDTFYTIGWSHGKEQFGKSITGETLYDTRKGSFYLDPFRNNNDNKNVFPSSLPLEGPLLEITHWMSQTTLWISQLCDAYLASVDSEHQTQKHNDHPRGSVFASLETRQNTKARLLYYFPFTPTIKNVKDHTTHDYSSLDDWCGWHKDHGTLTALLPGLIFDDDGDDNSSSNIHDETMKQNDTVLPTKPPGLYIQTRNKSQIHVQLPPTSIGIQLGETLEIMSGGRLRATPHAVTSGSGSTRSGGRASLAVFLQPEPYHTLPDCPATSDDSLRQRYRPTFGAFQQATTQAFH